MKHDELRYWLALLRVPGIGPVKFAAILKIFPELEELFRLPVKEQQALGLAELLKQIDWHGVERDLAWAESGADHHIITLQDAAYPVQLREITDPPPLLYVKGNAAMLGQSQLAMVGSRNPTTMGIEIAERFADGLAAAGIVITSGLALGIDAASHRGALIRSGNTVAVMGTDIEQIYPSKNQSLAALIVERGGALITEFPLGAKLTADKFPRRNRIVSGLSLGVLVVEATLKSGSLITARLAAEQGRDVFAIPGSIYNSRSKGCHILIKQGAKLVETQEDILDELRLPGMRLTPNSATRAIPLPLDEAHLKLLECIGYEPTAIDVLVQRSGLAVNAVTAMLLQLELLGYITAVPGCGYARSE